MSDDQAGARAPLSLRDYLSILWRRSWIVIAVTAIVFGVGLYRSKHTTKVYQAQGQIELASPGGNGTSSATDVDTQVGVIESPAVHAAAARKAPGIGQVSAQQSGLGNIINVSATSTDPNQTIRTVNATINAYVAYVEKQIADQSTAAAVAIEGRMSALQTQIDAANARVPPLGSALAVHRDQLVTEQSALQQRLDGLQFDNASAGTGLNVVGRPILPTNPIRPNPRTDGLLALGAGLLLGLVLAFFVEYLVRSGDTTEKRAQDAQPRDVAPPPSAAPPPPPLAVAAPARDELVRRSTGEVSLMGVIPTSAGSVAEVVSARAPDSNAAQSYRTLRDAAAFMGLERGRCFEVTSVPDRDGKTETLTNLAVLIAGTGQRVVVVDCDLRKPSVHEFFGLSNEIGLTSVMSGTPLAEAVMCVPALENLYVLAAGPPAADPDGMLGSERCREILDSLLAGGTLVLLDAPPVLSVMDALTLARTASVDGDILVVATANDDAREMLRQALDALHRSGDQPIGVVLTTTPDRASEHQPVRTVRRSRMSGRGQQHDPSDAYNADEALIRQLGHDGAFAGANGGAVPRASEAR